MTEKEKEEFWKDFKKDFLAGSASGAAVTLATQPLDTIAVRSQADTGGVKPSPKRLKKLKSKARVNRIKGIKGLYRGVGPRLLKSTAAGAIGYPVFMAAAKELEERERPKTASLIPITTSPNAAKILPKLYHSANPAEFGRSRSMKTSDAIDYLTSSWTQRPINIGKGKEYYGPTKVAALGGFLNIGVKAFKGLRNFAKGVTFTGAKSMGGVGKALKTPTYSAGVLGGVALPFAAPKMSKTVLEQGTKNTRSLSSNMFSPKNV